MLQLNKYKKICHLTDSEILQVADFFKELCKVNDITTISIYLDEKNDTICEIEGFAEPTTSAIGSCIKHDMAQKLSVERFKEFADQYNKRWEE